MPLQHRLLGPGFAVEVSGLDLARPLQDDAYAALRALWMEHKVFVLREQRLDESAMMSFTRPLGELFVHVRSQFHSKKHKEVMVLTNALPYDATRGAVGDNSELAWHSVHAAPGVGHAAAHGLLPARGSGRAAGGVTRLQGRARHVAPCDTRAAARRATGCSTGW